MVAEETILKRGHGTRRDMEAFHRGLKNLPWAMNLMGYSGLRKGQDAIVHNVLCLRDTLGFLPTGMGKTATFVLPALALEMRCLVFSPLVALMQDQVKGLWAKSIPAGQVNSIQPESANTHTLMRWAKGELQFLYVAPERLRSKEFIAVMRERAPDMVVVDEAHAIEQWADNFRAAYAKIGTFIKDFGPKVVLALTATATEEVEESIRNVLGIQDAAKIRYLPERTNLKLSSRDHPGVPALVNRVRELEGSGIIYCATVKAVEELGHTFSDLMPGEVGIFHGKLPPNEKRMSLEMFMQNQCRVQIATNAFGMGIDKPDIRWIVHHDMPPNLEALVQETGRAGRDGKESKCVTLYQKDSYNTQVFFIRNAFPSERDIRAVHRVLTRASQNEKGEILMKIQDIAAEYGNPYATQMVNSAIQILVRHGVIDRPKSDDKIAKVLVHRTSDDLRFQEYYQQIQECGTTKDDGALAFDMDTLSSKLGVGVDTVRRNLKKFQDAELLTFVPPFAGAPTRLTGDIEKVEFARLAAKYKEAMAKLDMVVKYFQVPDAEKHAYLRAYFES